MAHIRLISNHLLIYERTTMPSTTITPTAITTTATKVTTKSTIKGSTLSFNIDIYI